MSRPFARLGSPRLPKIETPARGSMHGPYDLPKAFRNNVRPGFHAQRGCRWAAPPSRESPLPGLTAARPLETHRRRRGVKREDNEVHQSEPRHGVPRRLSYSPFIDGRSLWKPDRHRFLKRRIRLIRPASKSKLSLRKRNSRKCRAGST